MLLENIITKLIAGKNDYSRGIKTYEKLKSSKDSQHPHITFNAPFRYKKTCQFKYYVALHQLVMLDCCCAFCGEKITASHKLVLSHNYGHNDNLTRNGGDQDLSRNNIIENHRLFSLIHAGCNAGHRKKNDDFTSLKLCEKLLDTKLSINSPDGHTFYYTIGVFDTLITDPDIASFIKGLQSSST